MPRVTRWLAGVCAGALVDEPVGPVFPAMAFGVPLPPNEQSWSKWPDATCHLLVGWGPCRRTVEEPVCAVFPAMAFGVPLPPNEQGQAQRIWPQSSAANRPKPRPRSKALEKSLQKGALWPLHYPKGGHQSGAVTRVPHFCHAL